MARGLYVAITFHAAKILIYLYSRDDIVLFKIYLTVVFRPHMHDQRPCRRNGTPNCLGRALVFEKLQQLRNLLYLLVESGATLTDLGETNTLNNIVAIYYLVVTMYNAFKTVGEYRELKVEKFFFRLSS